MKQRSFILVAAALVFVFVGVAAVYAYDSSKDDQIAKGVKVGGVDVGGMSTGAARAKVSRALTAKLNRPLYAVYHGRRFELTPQQARLKINPDAMVDAALHRSRDGNIISRTWRGLTGGKLHADIPVRASYSKAAIARLVDQVAHSVDRPARDASLSYSTGELRPIKAQKGLQVKTDLLRADVGKALGLPGGDRTVPVTADATRPKVTTKDLADTKKYSTVVAVNRTTHTLTLLKHLHKVKSYVIAVGMQGLETPAGQYPVVDKQVDPWWHVPHSAWAGKLAGRVIPPGPADPLKARWIGITGGAGIHGTVETGSLGSSASHGCIRMSIPDVIDLYGRVPYGSTIFIY